MKLNRQRKSHVIIRADDMAHVSEQLAVEVVSACYLNVLLSLVIKQHYLDTDGLNIETSRLISIAWVNWYNVVGMTFFVLDLYILFLHVLCWVRSGRFISEMAVCFSFSSFTQCPRRRFIPHQNNLFIFSELSLVSRLQLHGSTDCETMSLSQRSIGFQSLSLCVCVCVCVCEREWGGGW